MAAKSKKDQMREAYDKAIEEHNAIIDNHKTNGGSQILLDLYREIELRLLREYRELSVKRPARA